MIIIIISFKSSEKKKKTVFRVNLSIFGLVYTETYYHWNNAYQNHNWLLFICGMLFVCQGSFIYIDSLILVKV